MENWQMEFKDERRYEVIDGVVCMSPSPTIRHNKILFRLTFQFEKYLHGRKCSVHMTPNVYLEEDKPKNYVIPDLAVVCDPAKLRENGCYGVPDLLVEILSMNKSADKIRKFKLYERVGVQEYWIIEPRSNTLEQYVLQDGKYDLQNVYTLASDEEFEHMDADDKADYTTIVRPTIFDDCEFEMADIFE